MIDMTKEQRSAARRAFAKFAGVRFELARDGDASMISPIWKGEQGAIVTIQNGVTAPAQIEKDIMNSCRVLMVL